MLSDSQLERCSEAYRFGYNDGYYNRPARTQYSGFGFAAHDYANGFKAGANDAFWAKHSHHAYKGLGNTICDECGQTLNHPVHRTK